MSILRTAIVKLLSEFLVLKELGYCVNISTERVKLLSQYLLLKEINYLVNA